MPSLTVRQYPADWIPKFFLMKQRPIHIDPPHSLLSDRQLKILLLVAEGKTSNEAAKELHVTRKSVDSDKYRIMKKLNLHTSIHLARYAIRTGLCEA